MTVSCWNISNTEMQLSKLPSLLSTLINSTKQQSGNDVHRNEESLNFDHKIESPLNQFTNTNSWHVGPNQTSVILLLSGLREFYQNMMWIFHNLVAKFKV